MKKKTVNLIGEFNGLSEPCELCKIADRQNFRLKKSQHADREYIIQLLEEIEELKNNVPHSTL